MDRLISEQEVLDVIASWFESVEQQRILQGRIKAIPSADKCDLKELEVYRSIFDDDSCSDYDEISYGYVRKKIYDEVYKDEPFCVDDEEKDIPSAEPTDENLHREREQSYMQGYEDASKRFRQEPCEDAISREAALELFTWNNTKEDIWYGLKLLPSVSQHLVNDSQGLVKDLDKNDDAISRIAALRIAVTEYEMEKIRELPSVQQKTGHWITEDMFDGDVAYRCSECNELFWIECGTPKDNGYNFCPKCGKRLVESQDREDGET